MNRRVQSSEQDRECQKSGRAVVVRIYWLFFGYIPMVLSIAAMIESKSVPSGSDIAYWASTFSIVLARLYDIRRLGGRTAEGEQATLADWRLHAGGLLFVASLVWVGIRIFGR